MKEYIMAIKSCGWFVHPELRSKSEIIFKTSAENLSEAKDYFVRLKDLPEDKFDELYVVMEAKDE